MTSRPLSPLAIFDLDGTLVDTAADLVSSLNHTIAAAGLAPVTYDDLTHLVGQGARVMIKRAFALRETELPEAEIDPLYERFITHYRAEMPGESRPYPGIVKALDALSPSNWPSPTPRCCARRRPARAARCARAWSSSCRTCASR